MASQGSDGKRRAAPGKSDGQESGAAAKRKKTWVHNGVEFSEEPYPWKGKMFFAVSTGGGLESIFVEGGSTVWAHSERADYRMIVGQDDKWVKMPPPNTKNRKQRVSGKDIDEWTPENGGADEGAPQS